MSFENLPYPPPTEEISIIDAMFGIPNDYTGGQWINIFIFGIYSVFFISSMYLQTRPDSKNASIFAGFGTFITTFGLVLLSGYTGTPIAGENQLIPVTVIFIGSLAWKYVSSSRGELSV